MEREFCIAESISTFSAESGFLAFWMFLCVRALAASTWIMDIISTVSDGNLTSEGPNRQTTCILLPYDLENLDRREQQIPHLFLPKRGFGFYSHSPIQPEKFWVTFLHRNRRKSGGILFDKCHYLILSHSPLFQKGPTSLSHTIRCQIFRLTNMCAYMRG